MASVTSSEVARNRPDASALIEEILPRVRGMNILQMEVFLTEHYPDVFRVPSQEGAEIVAMLFNRLASHDEATQVAPMTSQQHNRIAALMRARSKQRNQS